MICTSPSTSPLGLISHQLLDKLGSGALVFGSRQINPPVTNLKILIACEQSGIVRDAFRAIGHDAYSCDILPSDSPYHIEGDALKILDQGWNAMICHPPCTDLAISGARWFPEKIADGRQQRAIDFAKALWNAPIEKIALENPISILSSHIRKPDQIIQPWQHGHEATKSTCLWLKGFPKLHPTQIVGKGDRCITKSGKSLPAWYSNIPSSKNRSQLRSITFEGIALAMASQWG